jgi:hypothetical protein
MTGNLCLRSIEAINILLFEIFSNKIYCEALMNKL